MTPAHVILTMTLATISPVQAQEGAEQSQQQTTWPVIAGVPARQAVGQAAAAARDAARNADDGQRRAGGGRDRERVDSPRTGGDSPRTSGDNPRTRRAEPRGERRERPAERARAPERRRTVVVRPRVIYNNHYRVLRPGRVYGYGPAFGAGYFYYSPYRGYPGASLAYVGPGGYPDQYDNGYQFDIGELRLQLSPRDAQVYVDGYYAGTVDDYDGTFQSLKLESGAYKIEIVAPSYETTIFDVRINAGQKTTYREDLRRIP